MRSIAPIVLPLLVCVSILGCGSANESPQASFKSSADKSSGEVELDASQSTDADNKITSYTWDFGDGQSGEGVEITHRYDWGGTYEVDLTVTDAEGATDSIRQSVSVPDPVYPPLIASIKPPDGAVISGTEVWVRWDSSIEATGRVLWRRAGDPEIHRADSGTSRSHLVRLGPLEVENRYEFVVEQTAGVFAQRSSLHSFTVESGVVFDPPVIDATVQRDYDQTVTLTLRNSTEDSITVAGKALKHFDDLPADIVGAGSADDPVELSPGQEINLRLAVFAPDSTASVYEIPVEAGGASALVRLQIEQPLFNLEMQVIEVNPRTLAKTIEILNNGDTLGDFALRVAPPHDREVKMQPNITHARLTTGATLRLVVSPILYLEFESLDLELECSAAGQIKRFPLSFAAPVGQRLYGVRGRSGHGSDARDEDCTNKGARWTNIPGPKGNGPASVPESPPDILPEPGKCEDLDNECARKARVLYSQWEDANDRLDKCTKEQRIQARYSDRWLELQECRQAAIDMMKVICEVWQVTRDQECRGKGRDIGQPPCGSSLPSAAPESADQVMKELLHEERVRVQKQIIGLERDIIHWKDFCKSTAGFIPHGPWEKVCEALFGVPRMEDLVAELLQKDVDLQEELRKLGKDPPSDSYSEVVQPAVGPPLEGAADNEVERLLVAAIDTARWRNAYLEVYLMSWERYQGAQRAGDQEAALQQAEAMVAYARQAIDADRLAQMRRYEFESFLYEAMDDFLTAVAGDATLRTKVGQIRLTYTWPEWLDQADLPADRLADYRRRFTSKTGEEILDEWRLKTKLGPSRRELPTLGLLALSSERSLEEAQARLAEEDHPAREHVSTVAISLRPGLLEALRRRASFTRAQRGPFAVPRCTKASDSTDYAAGWHASDRACFAWHQENNNIVVAAFDLHGETLMPAQVIGVGRWPRITAHSDRTAVAWQSGDHFTIRVHTDGRWGEAIEVPGLQAAIAFSPGGPLFAVTTVGLWSLNDDRAERIRDVQFSQPALAINANGQPRVSWAEDGRIMYEDEEVANGERPTIIITPDDIVHLAYVSRDALFVRSLAEGEWSSPKAIPAVDPKWPSLALDDLGNIRLSYIGAADYGPPALWLIRLPDLESVLIASVEGNVTGAWLLMNFSLRDQRYRYRAHDLLITFNDVWIKMFEDTVPEGRYLFRLSPNHVFTSPGEPVPNRIALYPWGMNNGDYMLVSNYQLRVRTAWSEYFAFGTSQEEVASAFADDTSINHEQPDLVLLANNLNLPVDRPEGSVDLPITVVNLGESASRPTRLVMSSQDRELITTEIPMLQPDEQFVTTFRLTCDLSSTEFHLVPIERDFDLDNDRLSLMLWGDPDEEPRVVHPVDQPGEQASDESVEVIPTPNDVEPPWVAGSLPAGATGIGEWNWLDYDRFRDRPTHWSEAEEAQTLHYFSSTDDPLPLAEGDNLVQYVYLDPEDPPQQIMLQLYTEGGRAAQQVYWGADLIQLPGVARVRAGRLPETGTWVRLRIPVKTLEMDELWLRGLLYAQYGGRVVWGPTTKSLDRLDKTPELLPVTEEGRPK